MRSSLRDAEATPPAGGWERLERELAVAQEGASPAPSQRPAWRIYWPRIAAAAAVVLIGIVAGDLLLRPDTVLKQEGVVITTADGGKTAEPLLPGSGGEAAGPVLAQAVPPARGAARETGSEASARLRKTTGRPGSEGGTAAETAGNAASLLLRTADATSEDAGAPGMSRKSSPAECRRKPRRPFPAGSRRPAGSVRPTGGRQTSEVVRRTTADGREELPPGPRQREAASMRSAAMRVRHPGPPHGSGCRSRCRREAASPGTAVRQDGRRIFP